MDDIGQSKYQMLKCNVPEMSYENQQVLELHL